MPSRRYHEFARAGNLFLTACTIGNLAYGGYLEAKYGMPFYQGSVIFEGGLAGYGLWRVKTNHEALLDLRRADAELIAAEPGPADE